MNNNAQELTSTLRGELIGKRVIATPKSGTRGKGREGVVRDETKQTITVEESDGQTFRLIKKDCIITLKNNNQTIEIDGTAIAQRGEDRLKLKVTS